MGLQDLPMQLARRTLGMLAGVMYGGQRDLYKVFGWTRNPTHKEFLAKYIHQDIAQRIINAPVDGVWTDAPILEGGRNFEKDWQDIVDSHDIYAWLAKADTFCGLGAFSILVVGIDDGLPLNTPANTSGTVRRKLTYLQPYLEGSVDVTAYENNPNSPRFGKPVMYRVKPAGDVRNVASFDAKMRSKTSFDVHWTRVLHLADNTLENNVFGHSRLEPVYNTLDDILKVTGGSAETYWLTSNRGLHINLDKDMELDEGDAEALSDEVDEYQHELRRVIRTRGAQVQALGASVADPKNTFAVQIALISANTGIPQRVLMGAEAGQLASQQDRANWAQMIAQRISKFAQPVVLKPFISMLVDLGVVRKPTSLKISWPEPFKMNPLEKAQTSAQQARSVTNVARAFETMQKVQAELFSIEEGRRMIAPGDKILIMDGAPTGTFPPKLSAPYNEPKNKLLAAPPSTEAPEGDQDGNSPTSQPGSQATSGTPDSNPTDDK